MELHDKYKDQIEEAVVHASRDINMRASGLGRDDLYQGAVLSLIESQPETRREARKSLAAWKKSLMIQHREASKFKTEQLPDTEDFL